MTYYQSVFGGTLRLFTVADLGRTDGPPDAIAHGMLEGPVALFAADALGDERPLRTEGLLLSLLGCADPGALRAWFERLADGGTIVEALEPRPWGATDGQVVDRYGLQWLIGFEEDSSADGVG